MLWNKCLSQKFSVSNRVRQDGVLSPILFTIYIDDLLVELEQKGIGCFLKHHFAGAVCYADDILSLHHHILLYVTCLQLAFYMLILTL